MNKEKYNNLAEAVNALTKNGYAEDFLAEEKFIKGLYSQKTFQPEELTIIESYRFEGDVNDPSDQSELFAIIATDGTRGTLVMSYSADHNQNVELIKQIKGK